MKECFIAIHDYGLGSIGIKIWANSKQEVAFLLPKPQWAVYGPDEAGHLSFLDLLPESDIDERSDLFQRLIDTSIVERNSLNQIDFGWLRSVGLTAFALAVAVMVVSPNVELPTTPTSLMFLIGTCLLGVYLALRNHQSSGHGSWLYRSLPFVLPLLVLAVAFQID